MDDYISREAVLKKLSGGAMDAWEYASLKNDIDSIPAADVVEVVRCGDCKFYTNGTMRMCCARGYIDFIYPGDFCSRGVRRTENAE